MAQVFLSYDREDAPKARVIAQALEQAGHFVWWDPHIKGGAEYGREIEQALEKSDAVVVLWSERSVVSAWVRDEAAAGRDSGRLVPVLIEPVSPPMGFRQYQNLDFIGWKGRGKPPRMAELLDSVDSIAKPAVDQPPRARSQPAPARRLPALTLPKWLMIGVGVMLVLITLSILLPGKGKRGGQGVHTVAVAAADAAAGPLARDLLVNLGQIQAAQSGTARLVSQAGEESGKAELIFEAASGPAGKPGATLVLMDGKDRSILWTKDFEQEAGTDANLKQQMAVTAGRVLGCALEGLDTGGRALDQQTLKLYLNGCAELAQVYYYYAGAVVPTFLAVIKQAPRFEGAWSKLLLAEAEVAASDPSPKGVAIARQLPGHIKAARALDPQMAEAYYAELRLLPDGAFERKNEIADKALALHPDNVLMLRTRSELMLGLGRMDEAVVQAKQAAELEPLSPVVRSAYITTLANAGHTQAALTELGQAEALWPGVGPMIDARFRIHARYGDPKISLQIMRTIMEPGIPEIFEAFLLARIDPTQANIDRAVAAASALVRSDPNRIGILLQVLGEFGRTDQIYQTAMQWRGTDVDSINHALFRPPLRAFRRDPRFMRVAARTRLAAYWRKTGKWPDFCSEPGLPYDCKAEAAKFLRPT